jgi:hypothetical protein
MRNKERLVDGSIEGKIGQVIEEIALMRNTTLRGPMRRKICYLFVQEWSGEADMALKQAGFKMYSAN